MNAVKMVDDRSTPKPSQTLHQYGNCVLAESEVEPVVRR